MNTGRVGRQTQHAYTYRANSLSLAPTLSSISNGHRPSLLIINHVFIGTYMVGMLSTHVDHMLLIHTCTCVHGMHADEPPKKDSWEVK